MSHYVRMRSQMGKYTFSCRLERRQAFIAPIGQMESKLDGSDTKQITKQDLL